MFTSHLNTSCVFHLLVIIFISGFLASCSDEQNEFTLGQEFIESGTSIRLIDTFSVKMSTVLLDSLISSTIDTLLVGNYSDNIFGRVTCNAFFEVGLPNSTNVLKEDIYDSITIILWYTGYSYGDTLSPLSISFHQLSEELSLRDAGYLYNTSSFNFDEQALATYTFLPKPNTVDSIEVRLTDDLGLKLFELMKSNDESISTQDQFIHFFKGLVIVPDTSLNACVIGFDALENHLKMKVYSHRVEETTVEEQYEFPVVNTDLQFNQIVHNFHSTPLNILNTQNGAIAASKMDGLSFTQGGTGIVTKIEFPTLNEFLLYERSFILKVEMIIYPARTSYNTFELPQTIYLYNTDLHNKIGELLYDSNGDPLNPVFTYDEVYFEETSYAFDITNFIRSEMSDSYFNSEHGLLMTFSYEEYLCSLKRVVFDAGKARLKIYYVNY
jgi:hypothetical protein